MLRRDVHRELEYGEVEGAGLLWGPNPMEHPPIPRQVSFRSLFAKWCVCGVPVAAMC